MVTLKTNDNEDLKDNVIQEIVEEDRTIPPPEKRFSALFYTVHLTARWCCTLKELQAKCYEILDKILRASHEIRSSRKSEATPS
jgi:hypothetical protein